MLIPNFRVTYICYLLYADDVPKEDFETLKYSFEELQKKHDEVLLERTQLEEDLVKKSEELESAAAKRQELEDKISTLESDIEAATKDSDILGKEVLGKWHPSLLRYVSSRN